LVHPPAGASPAKAEFSASESDIFSGAGLPKTQQSLKRKDFYVLRGALGWSLTCNLADGR
jgi:hypothetical protein